MSYELRVKRLVSCMFFVGLLGVLPACDVLDDRPIDSRKMARAIRDRKPQRITPKALEEWVKRKCTKFCMLAQADLYRQIKRGLADSTLKKVGEFDALPALPLVDSLTQQYGFEMECYSFSKKYDLPTEAQTLFEGIKKEASQESSVKESAKDEKIYFASPVVIDNESIGAWIIAFPIKSARRWYDYKDLRK